MRKLKSLLLAATFTLAALSAEAKLLQFEVTGGYNNANYSIDGYDGAISNNGGYQFGAGLTTSLILINAAAEVYYASNSFDITDTAILGDTASVKCSSIDMPLLAGISVFGPIRLEVGPRFSLYSKSTATLASGEEVDLGSINATTGYTAGLKVAFSKFVGKVRYNGSFGDGVSILDDEFKMGHNSISILVGIRF